MTYEIEKDVPFPPFRGKHADLKKVLGAMEVGDSVRIAGIKRGALGSLTQQFGRGYFAIRKDGDCYRIWRIKQNSE